MSEILFTTIVTHTRLHLDEICAIWLLMTRGEEKFPGISGAKIEIAGAGGENYEGINGDEFLEQGIIMVGVGGGMFDEHPGPENPGKKGECASTLVARHLGIENDPALQKVMGFVQTSDLKAVGRPFDLAAIVKAMHDICQNETEKVIRWAMMGLDAKYRQQKEFCRTQDSFEENTLIEEVSGPWGKMLKVMTAKTDDQEFNKVARTKGAAVIIQQRSTGQVQIYTNKKLGVKMHDVCQMIRVQEQYLSGTVLTTDWEDLAREGKVAGAEEWYFHYEGQMLLNGSLSNPDVPPTKIPLDVIRQTVRIGINPNAFEPSREAICQEGRCTSSREEPCPWYEYGLQRCRKVRYESKK